MALYVQSSQEMAQHYKVRRLARTLKISISDAIGRLHLLWWWALTFAQDGDLGGCDAEDIADVVMWDGDAETLPGALVNCGGKEASGFIERDGDGHLRLHDWQQHCKIFKEQNEARERMRKKRAEAPRSCDGASVDVRESSSDTCEISEKNKEHSPDIREHSQMFGPEIKNRDKEKETKDTPRPPMGASGRGQEQNSPEFEAFYAAYPRKVERKAAFRAWQALIRKGISGDDLLHAAESYAGFVALKGTEPNFIKQPATFLHEDRRGTGSRRTERRTSRP